ncbi:MAG: prenyltransferase/squalene oxidase repeat-containing protein [Candidatus Bathyarchaeota archaeon]
MASAATEGEIQHSINQGLAWLTSQQNPDGSWGANNWEMTAVTVFSLIKLQDRAYELEYESPFDPMYNYSENVVDGWGFVFSTLNLTPLYVAAQNLSVQTHGASLDDPDTNGNSIGVYFHNPNIHYTCYTTGLTLMALEASGTPGRLNDGGLDMDNDGSTDTFEELAQDAADWLAFAQGDSGNDLGGWGYGALDNQEENDWTDNSNSGYVVLGLAAAEGFGCSVPDWVKTELSKWIDVIQDPVDSDTDDGGSWYNPDWVDLHWVNELKTGNLIFEMTFVGDDDSILRFQDALDYINRHWMDLNVDPGWGYNQTPAGYQPMFTLMKGFEYSQIPLIDLDNDTVPEHDWYQEFAQVIVDQQNLDGSWPPSIWGDNLLSTLWALLTLEKVAPPPPVIDIYVDIKPGSWPNPINKRSRGVIPVAICGTEDFDVTTIDPASVRLHVEGVEEGVPPLRWSYEDVATPYTGDPGGGHEMKGDGFADLVLHFKTPEAVETLELCIYEDETIPLTIMGNLHEEFDGTKIMGQDYVWLKSPKGKGKG